MKAVLALADGSIYEGASCGAEGTVRGHLVSNRSAFGYQEIMTNLSSRGLLFNMTYPLIGNYGVNKDDWESTQVHSRGLILHEMCRKTTNWRATATFEGFLHDYGVVAIENIDTRSLARKIEEQGSMGAVISTERFRNRQLMAMAWNVCRDWDFEDYCTSEIDILPGKGLRLGILDMGLNYSLLEAIKCYEYEIVFLPHYLTMEEILAQDIDILFFSDGPGVPSEYGFLVELIQKLIGKLPMAGQGLGHALLAMALGAKVEPLKAGHFGGNLPVWELKSGKLLSTMQSHLYEVTTLAPGMEITHRCLHNQGIEGLIAEDAMIVSRQYQIKPEKNGDNDTLFETLNQWHRIKEGRGCRQDKIFIR